MTRFETEDGTQLGCTFFGGDKFGKLKFLTKTELQDLWQLDGTTKCFADNGWDGNLNQLRDLLFTLKQCDDNDMKRRGWGDRLDNGLHLTQNLGTDGKLFFTR